MKGGDIMHEGVSQLLAQAREKRLARKLSRITDREEPSFLQTNYYVLMYYRVGVGLFDDKDAALYYKRVYNQNLKVSTSGQVVPIMNIFSIEEKELALNCALEHLTKHSYCRFLYYDPSIVLVTPEIFNVNLNTFIDEPTYLQITKRIKQKYPNNTIVFI